MRNLSIQGLRGYLMIWIVLFHYTTRYPILYPSANMDMSIRFENGGEVGIVIFFIISGFFLAKGLLGLDSSNKKLLEFCMHKYLRLWFPYVVSIILIFICINIFGLSGRECSLKTFLIDVFFIYHPMIGYVDLAHWFIAHLIFVQCFLGVILYKVSKCNRVKLFRILIISFNLLFVILSIPQAPSHGILVIDTFIPFKSTLAVLVGIGIYLYRRDKVKIDLMLVCFTICSLSIWLSQVLICVYSILFYLLLSSENKIVKSIFQNKTIIEIGNMSFYWYLIHQNIGYIFLNKINTLSGGATSEYWILIVCAVTFCMGYLVKFLETMIMNKIYGSK